MTLKDNWADGNTVHASDLNTIADTINSTADIVAIAVQTANCTAVAGNLVPVDATSGNLTVTLPTSGVDGSRVIVEKVDASTHTVTVTCSGSDRFTKSGGSTTFVLNSPSQAATFQYAATPGVWYIVSGSTTLVNNADGTASASNTGLTTPLVGSSTLTTGTTPVVGEVNFYDATGGAISTTLPTLSGLNIGARLAIQKVDSTANWVTFACAGSDTLYGTSSTSVNLKVSGEQREVQVISVSGTKYWAHTSSVTPLSALDSRYLPKDSNGKLAVPAIDATGTASSSTFLRGDGSWVNIGAVLTPTSVKTANYTATAGSLVLCDASSGPFTVTLPSSPPDGSQVCIRKINSSTNTITVATSGTNNLNALTGPTSLPLIKLPNQAVTLQYSANSTGVWYPLSDDQSSSYSSIGQSLLSAPSQAAVRTLLGTSPTFDARDYGVIADGAQHNNVANLRDCFHACFNAGGGTIVLPAGVICTSEALINGTLTADSGNTYTNTSSIPVANSTPITVVGQGVGVTTLQLSGGFMRFLDLPYDGSNNQTFKNITLRGFTLDRQNIKGVTVGPPTALGTAVTLTANTWVTLPGVSATAFKNADTLFFPPVRLDGTTPATGTMAGHLANCRISGGNVQAMSMWTGYNYTVSVGDVVQGSTQGHTLIGNGFRGSSSNDYVGQGIYHYIDHILIEDVDIINVASTNPNIYGQGWAQPAAPDYVAGITLYGQHGYITNVRVNRLRVNGGNTGIGIGSGNTPWVDEIHLTDCFHDSLISGQVGTSGGFMASGVSAGYASVTRCKSRNAGDVAFEFDGWWKCVLTDCVAEESPTGFYYNSNGFVPAKTIAGPQTGTISGPGGGTLGSSDTVAVYTGTFPGTVAQQGLAKVGTELVWYRVAGTSGGNTNLTLWRGINGTTGTTHTAGATITFVEVEKTSIVFDRCIVNNTSAIMTSFAFATAFLAADQGSRIPLPPATYRDCVANMSGGGPWTVAGNPGQFIAWSGWRLSTTIENCRFDHNGITQFGTGQTAAAIGWDSPSDFGHYQLGYPIPPAMVYGRNNHIKVSGVLSPSNGNKYRALRGGRGYSRVDVEFSAEVDITNADTNSIILADFAWGDSTYPTILAPGSRVKIEPRNVGEMDAQTSPVPLTVGVYSATYATGGTTIVETLDVAIASNTGLSPSIIDPTQVSRVIIHGASAVSDNGDGTATA